MSTRDTIAQRIVHNDAFFADVVARAGRPPARRARPVGDRFPTLIRSITFQLLATNAANTIHGRVVVACGGDVTPTSLLLTPKAALREAGLNDTKATAMLALAEATRSGEVRFKRHGRMSDDAILRELTAIRGIGPWTAQMYLMHTLARRDVWPVGDYGVRMGWSLIHELPDMISEKDMRAAANHLQGDRSDVAWYCWQAVHFHRRQVISTP